MSFADDEVCGESIASVAGRLSTASLVEGRGEKGRIRDGRWGGKG